MRRVGPQGLRAWLRAALGNSYANLARMSVQVNEIVGLRAIEKGSKRMRPAVDTARRAYYLVEARHWLRAGGGP